MQKIVLICVLVMACLPGNSQDTIRLDTTGYPLYGLIKNGDTTLLSNIQGVAIYPKSRHRSERDLNRYRRLIYNVKVVYPYAKLAGAKYNELNDTLATITDEKQQKEYIKKVEKEIKDKYELKLKDLTVTQGQILIKLIYRETNHTSYELVKDLRGSFQATIWQTLARLFGENLKAGYDPEGEDKILNEIVTLIDQGQL